jgi:SAM-dependent methyltransferase
MDENMTQDAEYESRQGEIWSSGDYAAIGSRLVIVSELLCEAVDLRAGQHVLDVATGHGNTALAAARRDCDVTGIDITPSLLEQARQRAAAEHLQIHFQEGEAEAIPFPDESFDAVLSTFGSIFASDAQRAANELLRVCRPSGRIGLTTWATTGASAVIDQVYNKYLPPDPPDPWATAEGLHLLFGDRISSLQVETRKVIYRFLSIGACIQIFSTAFGPFIKILKTLGEGRDRFQRDLTEAYRQVNQSGDPTLVVAYDYLEVVATK